MSLGANAEQIPVGGGDTVPLIRDRLTIGRRESCDICLRFPNVSSLHCALSFRDGYWEVRDLNSTNGVKVNGNRIQRSILKPGDELSIAKRRYVIEYHLAVGQRALDELLEDDVMAQPLLEKAGLVRPQRHGNGPPASAP